MDAVIFDMDGVVVDSERYWEDVQRELLTEILEETGIDAEPEDVQGMNPSDQYDALADRGDLPMTKEEYIQRYDDRAEDVYRQKAKMLGHLREMLETARSKGKKTALVSSSYRRWIDMVLDRFALRDQFDTVVSAEDIEGDSKPAPDIYLHAARELGVDPEDCLVIEDSIHGITAAREAGMRVIGIERQHNSREAVAEANYVVTAASELRTLLHDLS